MRDSDIDELVGEAMVEANALAARVNTLFQRKDLDAVLGAMAVLIASYLKTMPVNEREAELQHWLRLVRSLAQIGGRGNA